MKVALVFQLMEYQQMNRVDYHNALRAMQTSVVMHPSFVDAIKELTHVFELKEQADISRNIFCTGASGVGKTTLISQMKLSYPDTVTKITKTIPVLVIQTPSKPTVKNFAEAFLVGLEDPLAAKGTAIEKTMRVIQLAKGKGVKMVIVDELQHFVDHGVANALREVSDWLKGLIDELNVPSVLVGLERSVQILSCNEQLRRRFSHGISLDSFSIGTREQLIVFAKVIQELSRLLPLEPKMKLSEELVTRFYYATNGLIDYVVKLLSGAMEKVMFENKPEINAKVLQAVFKERVWFDCDSELNPFHKEFVEQTLDKQANMPFFVANT